MSDSDKDKSNPEKALKDLLKDTDVRTTVDPSHGAKGLNISYKVIRGKKPDNPNLVIDGKTGKVIRAKARIGSNPPIAPNNVIEGKTGEVVGDTQKLIRKQNTERLNRRADKIRSRIANDSGMVNEEMIKAVQNAFSGRELDQNSKFINSNVPKNDKITVKKRNQQNKN